MVMKWDELKILRSSAPDLLAEYRKSHDRKAVDRWCDYMEFVLCLIYDYGWKDAEQIVGIVPFKDGLDDKTVNLEINGETYRERVFEQLDEDSLMGVLRIIDTEAHRDYNTGVYDAAKESGVEVRKQWVTMMDELVRDTHSYLEGMVVGMDDRFYTFDGDSARFPGDFTLPQNNCNCRCSIVLVK
jgi:hypothetical protein